MKPHQCYFAVRFGPDEDRRVEQASSLASLIINEETNMGTIAGISMLRRVRGFENGKVNFVLLHNPVLRWTQIFFSQHSLAWLQTASVSLASKIILKAG